MLNIALPKGRLGDKIYTMFERAGYDCPLIKEESRKLVFDNFEKNIRFFWVKPSDVSIYVEEGIADIGAAGKDVLLENRPDVIELMDLQEGKCRMCVAAKKEFRDPGKGVLKVATKYPRIATDYYSGIGRNIDIIKLNGSVELAPILGLSDVIVDIVETGNTLKDNNLEIKSVLFPVSAFLIANKNSYYSKKEEIQKITEAL